MREAACLGHGGELSLKSLTLLNFGTSFAHENGQKAFSFSLQGASPSPPLANSGYAAGVGYSHGLQLSRIDPILFKKPIFLTLYYDKEGLSRIVVLRKRTMKVVLTFSPRNFFAFAAVDFLSQSVLLPRLRKKTWSANSCSSCRRPVMRADQQT